MRMNRLSANGNDEHDEADSPDEDSDDEAAALAAQRALRRALYERLSMFEPNGLTATEIIANNGVPLYPNSR